jgi:hypothetical protein
VTPHLFDPAPFCLAKTLKVAPAVLMDFDGK